MREWKNKNPPQMAELTKATIIFLGATNAITVMYILYSNDITFTQIFGIISSVALIYLLVSGKFFSILR